MWWLMNTMARVLLASGVLLAANLAAAVDMPGT
jgi:hypothetical protein